MLSNACSSQDANTCSLSLVPLVVVLVVSTGHAALAHACILSHCLQYHMPVKDPTQGNLLYHNESYHTFSNEI